jgi:peptidoglycan-associated lipoprotein
VRRCAQGQQIVRVSAPRGRGRDAATKLQTSGREGGLIMHRTPILVGVALAFALGCASKPQVKPQVASVPRSAAEAPAPAATTAPAGTEAPLVLAPIHFDFDKAIILDADRAILDGVAEHLLANPHRELRISGHCDERGTVEYNIALGDRRAAVAREYLVRLGVAPERIRTISFGEAQPADAGHDEAAWAKNRRDEFAVEEQRAQK